MLYIKLFIEREKNTGQSAPECPFNCWIRTKTVHGSIAAGQILGDLIDEYLVDVSIRRFMDEAVQIIVRFICGSHVSHIVNMKNSSYTTVVNNY